MSRPVIIQLDEKSKGSKLLGSPSRLTWEEGGRTFIVEYKRRSFNVFQHSGSRERSGGHGHGMLGINSAEAFFVKIIDNPGYGEQFDSLEKKQKYVEENLCKEAESLNLYYGKDCCRVLRRTKIVGDGNEKKRYYLIMPKEKGVAVSVKLQNESSEQIHWEAAITQAMHPLYYMATLKRDKNMTFVHKDIKLLNLIWPDATNTPFKLIDFGTAWHSFTSDVIQVDIKNHLATNGYRSPKANEQEDKIYKNIRSMGYAEKDQNLSTSMEYTYHDDHYAMAATLSLIYFKKFGTLPFIAFEPPKNEIQTGFGYPINDARMLIYHIGQLNDTEFEHFLKRNTLMTKEQINFITWIRPFTNGTSENTPEYIENKLKEYRTLFGLKEGEGISTYTNITFDHHADLNQLSSQPKQTSTSVKEKTLCQVIAGVFVADVDDDLPLETVVAKIHDAVDAELKRLDSGSSKYWYQYQRTDIKKYMPIYNARRAFEKDPTEANAKQLRNALNIKRNPSDSAEADALTHVKDALKTLGTSTKNKM